MFKAISDKLLFYSASGTTALDFTLAFGGETSGSYPDGMSCFIVETTSTTYTLNVVDGRGFSQIATLSQARQTSSHPGKISGWAAVVLQNGDIGMICQQGTTTGDAEVVGRKLTHTAFTSISNFNLFALNNLNAPIAPFVRIFYESANDRIAFLTSDFGTGTRHYYSHLINSSFSYIGNVLSLGTGINFIAGPTQAYDSTNNRYGIFFERHPNSGPDEYVYFILNSGHTATVASGTLFTATHVGTAASSTYKEGTISMVFDAATNEFIAVRQVRTSGVTFTHDIELLKLDSTSIAVTQSPTVVFSSTPLTSPSRTSEQAARDLILTSNGKLVMALEVLDYPGNNSKILIIDKSTLSVLQTIDLGAPGPVRLSVRNNGRIVVMHQEVVGGNSKIYIKTFWDDSTTLPPLAIRLKDRTTSSTTTASSRIVSLDIGTANTIPSGFLLSETQTTNPNTTNPALYLTTAPTTVSLSAGNGTKQVYAWYTNPTTSLWSNISTISLSTSTIDASYDSSTNLVDTESKTYTLGGNLLATKSSTFNLSTQLLSTRSVTSIVSANLLSSPVQTYFLSTNLLATRSGSFSLSAQLLFTHSVTSNISANLLASPIKDYLASINLLSTDSRSFSLSAELVSTRHSTFSTSSRLLATRSSSFGLSAEFLSTKTKTHSSSSQLLKTTSHLFDSSTELKKTNTQSIQQSAELLSTNNQSFISSADLQQPNKDKPFSSSGRLYSPVLGATLELRDTTTGSSLFAKSRVVSTEIATFSPGLTGFLLSETATDRAAALQESFVSVAPQTFLLSNPDGIKTVYFWTHDSLTVSLVREADLITLDRSVNLNSIQLTLKDRATGSLRYAKNRTVSSFVAATGPDAGSLSFLLSETQINAPDIFDNRFVSTMPLTIRLSIADGIKTAHLWCRDLSGNLTNAIWPITLVQSIDVQTLILDLFDRTTGSTSLTDSRIISTVVSVGVF